MRWRSKSKPIVNDIRIVKRFVFYPMTLDDETRWLEICSIVQACYEKHYIDWNGRSCGYNKWRNIGWAEDTRNIKDYDGN